MNHLNTAYEDPLTLCGLDIAEHNLGQHTFTPYAYYKYPKLFGNYMLCPDCLAKLTPLHELAHTEL